MAAKKSMFVTVWMMLTACSGIVTSG